MANTANTTALTTDFNVTPYYDDYDPEKGYYRILFKPGYAVQARELTQIQSSLQEQIQRFGRNIFKDGTIVLPGAFYLETNDGLSAGRGVRYVKVKDTDSNGDTVDISEWNNFVTLGKANGNTRLEVVGATTNIRAKIVQTIDGVQTSSNTKTIYVAYSSASTANGQIKVFQAGETLTANVNGTLRTLVVHDTDPKPVGSGSRFSISSGVLFAKNHFIAFPDQSIIIDRYNPNPTARVGFYITEEIVSATRDASLLDPAQEASNFSAPGADRLLLNPELAVVGINDTTDVQNFVTLFTVENGVVKTYLANTQYSYINDAMARRTYDNSGDYVINGLEVQLKEHDDTGSNYGRYTSGNNKLLYVGVSPGTGYCQGYQVGLLSTFDMSTEKGLSSANVNGQYAAATMGQYVTVNEFVGGWELNKGNTIDLYDTYQYRISGRKWSTGAQTGNKIGTATLLSYEYVTGTPGYDAKYNVYLADITFNGPYTFSNVKNLRAAGSGVSSAIGADVVPTKTVAYPSGIPMLQRVPDSTLLYRTGSDSTRTIRSASDISQTDTSFIFNDTAGVASSVEVKANGNFTISISPGDEKFPYGTTTLSGVQTNGLYLTFNQTSVGATETSITLPGSAASGTGTDTLTGLGTKFLRLNVGDKISISGNSRIYYVTAINNNLTLKVDSNLPSVFAANTIYKVYKSGDMIALNALGSDSGEQRVVTATDTTLRFDLKETFPSIFYATVSYPLVRRNALEIKKDLRTRRYVKINCATHPNGVAGPYDLGFSDVYKVRTIRVRTDSTFPTSNTDGTNATTSFVINNGQKDTHYDHGTIKPQVSLSSTTRILVELDYFISDFTNRGGYFSIDSYPVQDDDALFNASTNIRTENIPIFRSPTNGATYDLRNCLDFRPIKTNSATDALTVVTASTNPAKSTSFSSPASGLKFPVPSSLITYDFHYYLGRTDLLIVDKDNNFQIIKGIPSANPQTPQIYPGTMALYSINIAPYPSLSPAYAVSLGRSDLACSSRRLSNIRFTMRDIGVLKQRIVNLEYYTSLSVLERSATSTSIQNDLGGERFKNGIFTDTFRDDSLSRTDDTEQRITFDPEEKSIRPLYKMETVAFDYKSGTNVKYNSPVITLNYTEVEYFNQLKATVDVNVERGSWLYIGTVNLFPDQDIWIDTNIMPDEKLGSQSIKIVTYGSQANGYLTNAYTTDKYGYSGNTVTTFGNFTANATPGVVDIINSTEWKSWQKWVTGYKIYKGTGSTRTLVGSASTYDQARTIANSNNPVGGPGVTIETVYNNQRTGTQYWEAAGTDVVQTDYKIIDIQSYPYIRPQMITVQCTGLKPFTRVWPFFDNVPVANNSRPVTANQFGWIIKNGQFGLPSNTVIDLTKNTTSNNMLAAPSTLGTWSQFGSDLVTDSNGEVTFQFQVTSGQFRVGQRSMLVIDSRLPVDQNAFKTRSDIPDEISTGGTATFTASGQSVTKQRTILSTKTVSYHSEAVRQDFPSSDWQSLAAPPPPARCSHSCSAYSFLARAPNGEEGIFLTGVDIFVSRIGRQGFWVEIREMDAGQTITRNTVPYSEVFFNDPTKVPISSNGKDNPCKVKFQAPVFLYDNTQYAIVIHPINANPDLYVWVAKLGQNDVNGLGPVVDRRGFGTFFQTNNNTNWDIVPDTDLTCYFYRAEFAKNVDGIAYLANKPLEKIFLKNQSITFGENLGELVLSGDKLTTSIPVGGSISVGDVIHGNTSGQNSTVINISAGMIHCSNTGYIQGEEFYVLDGTTLLSKAIFANILDISNAYGTLDYYIDGPDTSLLHLGGSGGGFVTGDSVICSTDWSKSGVIEKVESISNFRYSTVTFEPSYLSFKNTDIQFYMRPTTVAGTLGTYFPIDPSELHEFNREQAILSKSNEMTLLGGTQSMNVQVIMRSSSNAVSPVVDAGRTHAIIIDNIINNNTTGETWPTNGLLLNKYMTKTVTLAEGQDAEDIRIILAAYRPPGTDVKVWIKILNAEDDTPFDERPWTELYKDNSGDVIYSDLDHKDDFKEYTFLVPTSTIDRVTLANTKGIAVVNVGDTLEGLTSAFTSRVNSIEGSIYLMSGSGYSAGETANVIVSGVVVGNTEIYATGRPVALNGGVSNVISYTTDSGVTYSSYKYFAVKIGLLNDGLNTAIVPRVGDLRVIALQM
jgi:hypothetical protein